MKRILSFTIAALLLVVASAAGQAKAELSFGGGITQPTGTFGDASKTGWHGLASIAAFPGDHPIGLQGTVFYGQNNFQTGSGKTKLFGGLGELKLEMRTDAAFKPYAVVGGGLVNAKATGGSGSTKGALDVGIGVGYIGASKVGFFVEGRYVNVFDSGPDLQFIPISAGLRIALK